MSHMLKWCWIETLQYTFKIFQAISRRIWDTHTQQTETRTPILCNTLKPRREIVACLPNRLSFWPPQHHTWVLSQDITPKTFHALAFAELQSGWAYCQLIPKPGFLPKQPQNHEWPMDFHGRLVDSKLLQLSQSACTIGAHLVCYIHALKPYWQPSVLRMVPCSHLQWWCQRQLCLQGPAEWRNRSTHYKCNLMPAGSCRLLHSCVASNIMFSGHNVGKGT